MSPTQLPSNCDSQVTFPPHWVVSIPTAVTPEPSLALTTTLVISPRLTLMGVKESAEICGNRLRIVMV